MEDYLVHHGILGMKWGIRRYQNKDGSLTPAGKERIAKQYEKLSSKAIASLILLELQSIVVMSMK